MANNVTVPRAKYEEAREKAYGDITSSFTRIGAEFGNNYAISFVHNYTDAYIDFGINFDGTKINFTLEPGGKITADMLTNQVEIAIGESAWCQYRDSAPTKGFVQVCLISQV